MDKLDQAKAFFRLQKNIEASYRRVFLGDNKELHASGKEVVADLKVFCNGTKSNFSTDALEMARAEGRREVFLHILDYLKLDYIDDTYDIENDYNL